MAQPQTLFNLTRRVREAVGDYSTAKPEFSSPLIHETMRSEYRVVSARLPSFKAELGSDLTIAPGDSFSLLATRPYGSEVRIEITATGKPLTKSHRDEIDALRAGDDTPGIPERFCLWNEAGASTYEYKGLCWPPAAESTPCTVFADVSPEEFFSTTDWLGARAIASLHATEALALLTAARLLNRARDDKLERLGVSRSLIDEYRAAADILLYREAVENLDRQSVGRILRTVP